MARSKTGGPQLSLLNGSPPLSPADGANSLFFALQPDAAAADHIRSMVERLRATRGIQGPLRASVLHVTLTFLGGFTEVPQDRVEMAGEVAQALRLESFPLHFDRVMTFKHPLADRQALVLCRDDADRCAALDTLRATLVRALGRRGLVKAESRIFRPHVTLLYDRKEMDLTEVEPISWTVRDFALLYSLSGKTIHRVLKRFPLL
jgi:RNA 2',3'-cyclic 3'-phosphodiesterase